RVQLLREGKAEEIGLIPIFFLAFEENVEAEVGGVVGREYRRGELAGLGDEVEFGLRESAEEFDLGTGIDLVAELGLEIGGRGGVTTFCLLAAEEAAVGA